MDETGNEPVHEENSEPCDDSSAFADLYKYSSRTASFTQDKRRELFLRKQKEKRCEAFDEKRDLSELFPEESPELMECESSSRSKCKKCPFSFKLMKSEWLTEIPEDLADNWLIKLCPAEGVRFLVVANKGITVCYFANGRSALRFKSNLPGGSSQSLAHKFTVLDCIYNKHVKTFFVYDVLAWNSMSLINAEAHMRFCWLQSKFEENPDFCKTKNCHFVVVEFLPAQPSLIQDFLFTSYVINECEVPYGGVLFYHKEGHYNFGSSPLVGWLKTFMLPELLHIDVHPDHLQNKPENYESVEKYLSQNKKKKKIRKADSSLMEMEEGEAESVDCENI